MSFESKAFVLQNPYWFMEQEPNRGQKPIIKDDEEKASEASESKENELDCWNNGKIIDQWNGGEISDQWLVYICHLIQELDIRESVLKNHG